jgi:hypothetical protein
MERLSPRDSNQIASGKPGAVQNSQNTAFESHQRRFGSRYPRFLSHLACNGGGIWGLRQPKARLIGSNCLPARGNSLLCRSKFPVNSAGNSALLPVSHTGKAQGSLCYWARSARGETLRWHQNTSITGNIRVRPVEHGLRRAPRSFRVTRFSGPDLRSPQNQPIFRRFSAWPGQSTGRSLRQTYARRLTSPSFPNGLPAHWHDGQSQGTCLP